MKKLLIQSAAVGCIALLGAISALFFHQAFAADLKSGERASVTK
jgi:hypothetical protein